MDGFSCSDSEDDEADLAAKSKILDIDEVEDVGNVRIEFRGRNLAEAIEDEEQTKNRMATLAKNQEEDEIMVADLPWNLNNLEDSGHSGSDFKIDWTVVKVGEDFSKDNHLHQIAVYETEDKCDPLKLPKLEICSERAKILPENLPKGVLPRESDIEVAFSFDLQPNLVETCGPSPSLLLQALTMSNSNDVINLGKLIICLQL